MKFISQLSSFISIILGIIFTGCENHSNKTKNIDIYPIKEITEYADSTYFFGLINNSTATDSFIVLNDRKLKRAILYDTSLNYMRMIGGGGKGPKEFIGLEGNPIVDDNYIYLYDIGRNKIKIFTTQGKYIKSFNYPFKSGADFIHFDYDKDKNNKFYSSSYLTNKPVFKFNQNGIILNEYGKFIPSIDNRHKRVQNYRHIIHHNNKIIAINIRKPRIEIFSANNGKLIKQYNFNHFFEFYLNRVKRRIREDSKNIYKKPILFRDTYFTNNTLYLLFYGDYDQHPFANQIAVINVVNNNLYFKKVYNLKTEEGIGSFSSICVINNKIVAFDVLSGKLLIYNIIKN